MNLSKKAGRAAVAGALIAAAALVAVGGAALLGRGRASRPLTLLIAHGIEDRPTLAGLEEALKAYASLNSGTSVELRFVPPRSDPGIYASIGADLVALSGADAASGAAFLEAPRPWTGGLWVLAARRDYLDAASAREPEAVAALRAGKASASQFESLLGDAEAAGLAPIALGNSHGWPFLLWLQHWAAATAGPLSSKEIPAPRGASARPNEAADPYSALRAPFAELMRWKRMGWFAKDAWPEGWARGLLPLDQGKAAFALVSARQLSAISPKGRAALEYLPFPRRAEDGPWSVGYATYLGVAARTAKAERARRLLVFLTSPGTVSRLAELTGRPFFAWDAATGKSPIVLSDWSTEAMSPPFEALAKAFDPGS